MTGQDFYTLPELPRSIRQFDSEVRQLGVGRAGKNGYLKVVLEGSVCDRTVIREQFSQAPLHMHRAMYHDMHCPGMAYLYVMSTSGGILQGDRYRMDITLRKDAMAHITTQGATRIYGMNANWATQMINVTLESGAYLELVPDQIIPYRSSRFCQSVSLNVHESAVLVCSEMVTPGRVAMGESFAYDVCHLRTAAHNHMGVSRFVDVADMEPAWQEMASPGVMGGHGIVGSVYILAPRQNVLELEDVVHARISQSDDNVAGVSRMKDDAGLLVRILGDQTAQVRGLVLEIAADVRRTCKGAGFPDLRKN